MDTEAKDADRLNFNSRTHVECDFQGDTPTSTEHVISTHALTWSATEKTIWIRFIFQISTHALTWSATC